MEFEFMTADTVLPPCMPLPTAMLRLPVSSTAKVKMCIRDRSRRNRRPGQEILWQHKISAIMGAEHLTMEREAGRLCTLASSHYGTP